MKHESMKVVKGPAAEELLLDILKGEAKQTQVQTKIRQHGLNFRLDLSETNFDALRGNSKDGVLRISRAEFPKGIFVDFSDCDFGDGDISFYRTKFQGGVSFENARFGKGEVRFDRVRFVNPSFQKCSFEKGERLSFRGAVFDGISDMSELSVDKTVIDFGFARSDPGDKPDTELRTLIMGNDFDISFRRCSSTELNFDNAEIRSRFFTVLFGEHARVRDISFKHCSSDSVSWSLDGIKLDEPASSIEFFGAVLEDVERFRIELSMGRESLANFSTVHFPTKGPIVFEFTSMVGGEVVFGHARIAGDLFFIDSSEIHATDFDFSGARFGSNLDISGFHFGGVPDFSGTVFSTHVSLHGVEYQYNRQDRLFHPDPYPENAAKLQRLKELAENNRDHQLALSCHADEMRARRWQHTGTRHPIADALDVTYDLVSNYGQLIARPVWLLFATWLLFSVAYLWATPLEEVAEYSRYLGFAIAMAFPFLPASGLLRGNEFIALFGKAEEVLLGNVYFLMGVQGILSAILLFLIGLGLRNRFRI